MSSPTTVSLLDTPFPDRDKVVEQSRELTPVWNKSLSDLYRVTYKAQRDLTIVDNGARFDFGSEDFYSNVGGPGTGSWDIIDSEDGHIGIQRLTTDVNNGDVTSVWMPVAANAGIYRWDQIDYCRWVFRTPPNVANCAFEAGMSSNPAAGWPTAAFDAGNDMFYLTYNSASSSALRFRVRVGGSVTTTFTVVDPCPTSTWIDVTWTRRRPAGNTDYVLDMAVNEVPGKTTTTVATASLSSASTTFGPMIRVGTLTNAARSIDIDLIDPKPLPIGARWTVAL